MSLKNLSWANQQGNIAGSHLRSVEVEIKSGQTTSTMFQCGIFAIAGITYPAAFTGTSVGLETAATSKQIEGGGAEEADYQEVLDSAGSAVSIHAEADKTVMLAPADFCGLGFTRLVATAQAADRIVTVHLRLV